MFLILERNLIQFKTEAVSIMGGRQFQMLGAEATPSQEVFQYNKHHRSPTALQIQNGITI